VVIASKHFVRDTRWRKLLGGDQAGIAQPDAAPSFDLKPYQTVWAVTTE
jgi:hypothetical protein